MAGTQFGKVHIVHTDNKGDKVETWASGILEFPAQFAAPLHLIDALLTADSIKDVPLTLDADSGATYTQAQLKGFKTKYADLELVKVRTNKKTGVKTLYLRSFSLNSFIQQVVAPLLLEELNEETRRALGKGYTPEHVRNITNTCNTVSLIRMTKNQALGVSSRDAGKVRNARKSRKPSRTINGKVADTSVKVSQTAA